MTGTQCSDKCWIQWIPSGSQDGIIDTQAYDCEMSRVTHTNNGGDKNRKRGQDEQWQTMSAFFFSAKLKKRHCPQTVTVCLRTLWTRIHYFGLFFFFTKKKNHKTKLLRIYTALLQNVCQEHHKQHGKPQRQDN